MKSKPPESPQRGEPTPQEGKELVLPFTPPVEADHVTLRRRRQLWAMAYRVSDPRDKPWGWYKFLGGS